MHKIKRRAKQQKEEHFELKILKKKKKALGQPQLSKRYCSRIPWYIKPGHAPLRQRALTFLSGALRIQSTETQGEDLPQTH